MSDPRRLLDGDPDRLTAAILEGACEHGVSPATRRQTIAAIKLAGGASHAAARSATATKFLSMRFWAAIAVVGAGAAGGATWLRSEPTPPPIRPSTSATQPAAPARRAQNVAEAAEETEAAPPPMKLVEPLDPAPSSPPRTKSKRARTERQTVAPPTNVPRDDARSVADEIRLLDQTREMLRARDAAGALTLLDDYTRHHPLSVLSDEATVCRIEALLLEGEARTARVLGDRMLRDHPGSVHAQRIRSLLEAAGSP